MSYLKSNLPYLRRLWKLSQEGLAEKLNCTRSRIGAYEEGRSEPPLDLLIDISNFFDVPIDTLVRMDLRKSQNQSFIKIGNNRVLFPITVDKDNRENIEVVPIEASAGYLRGYSDPEFIEDLQRFRLPFLTTGTHRAFPVQGDSMLPVKSGSIIVGRFVEDIQALEDGKTYILLTKQDGLVYKRVYKKLKECNSLELHSDNTQYAPYEVKSENVLELWKFACCIQRQEPTNQDLKISNISQMLKGIQIELQSLETEGLIV